MNTNMKKIDIFDPRRGQGMRFHTGVDRYWHSEKAGSLVCTSYYPNMNKESVFNKRLLHEFGLDMLGLYIMPFEARVKHKRKLLAQLEKPSLKKEEYYNLFENTPQNLANMMDCLSQFGSYEDWYIACMKSTDSKSSMELEFFSNWKINSGASFYERTDLFNLVLHWNIDYDEWIMVYNDSTRFDEMIEFAESWNLHKE